MTNEQKTKLEKRIENIMDWFDFETLADAWMAVDFGWTPNETSKQSVIAKARQMARDLIRSAWEEAHERNEHSTHATGGLTVSVWPNTGMVEMTGYVSSWTAGYDYDNSGTS